MDSREEEIDAEIEKTVAFIKANTHIFLNIIVLKINTKKLFIDSGLVFALGRAR